MSKLLEHVEAEWAEMAGAIALLPADQAIFDLSPLELAGVGGVLHSFYNGVERTLRFVAKAQGRPLPHGLTSHRDLLLDSILAGVLSQAAVDSLGPFMQFRHYFRHGYALRIDPAKIEPLCRDVHGAFELLKADVLSHLSK